MAQLSPRKKPTNVMLNFRAGATAKLHGADAAATLDIPATNAFCVILKLARPLTIKIC